MKSTNEIKRIISILFLMSFIGFIGGCTTTKNSHHNEKDQTVLKPMPVVMPPH